MPVEHINPEGMHHNPAFSQAILLPAGARSLIIGGQNAVGADGQVVGKGDIGAQTAKALENLQLCLRPPARPLRATGAGQGTAGDIDIRWLRAWMAVTGHSPLIPVTTASRVHGLRQRRFPGQIKKRWRNCFS